MIAAKPTKPVVKIRPSGDDWRSPIVYLAGPITHVVYEVAMTWRILLSEMLLKDGIASYNPAGAWCGDKEDIELPNRMQVSNDVVIATCDAMVVAYAGCKSIGTDHEIQLGMSLQKPVIILYMNRNGYRENRQPVATAMYDEEFMQWVEDRNMSGCEVCTTEAEVTAWMRGLFGRRGYDPNGPGR